VVDQWFTAVVTHHCRGYCELSRDADNTLAVFDDERDAQRFMRVLPLRLAKFGLRLNAHKTRLFAWGRCHARRAVRAGERPPTFDFLGFTYYWG
jgi:hypothetical protein